MSAGLIQSNKVTVGAAPIFAGLLAAKCGVRLEWSAHASTASTDGRTITLPMIPLEDAHLAALVNGFILHEDGHIQDTDFDESGDDDLEHKIVNYLEDVRIERAQCQRYPGAHRMLHRMTDALVSKGLLGKVDAAAPLAVQILRYVLLRPNADLLYPQLAGPADAQEAILEPLLTQGAMIKLRALVGEVAHATSTAAVKALAKKIKAMLQEEAKAKRPPADSKPGDNDASSGADDSAGVDAQQAGPAADQDAAAPTGSGDAQEEDQSGNQAAGAPTGSDVAAGEDPNGSQAAGGPTGGGHGSDDGDPRAQAIEDALRWTGPLPDDLKGIGDLVAQEIGTTASTRSGRVAMPNGIAIKEPNAEAGQQLVTDTRAATTALLRRMDELVQTITLKQPIASMSGTRLRRDAGSRFMRGNLRVFERRAERVAIDTAIDLVLDISGSMRDDDKFLHAAQAMVALGLALERIQGVTFGAIAFPYQYPEVGIVKDFGENVRQLAARVGALSPLGGTPMAEAMLFSHHRLAARREPRRICIVITDGDADNRAGVADVIRLSKAYAIENMAVGIRTDPTLFEVRAVVKKLDDLPREVMSMMRQALFGPNALLAA